MENALLKKLARRAVLVTGLLVIAGGLLLIYLGGEAEIIQANPETPTTVFAGQSFEVILNLRNVSASEQQIVSIAVESQLDLQITSMAPNYRTIEAGKRWTEYIFSRQLRPILLPNDTLRLRVTMLTPKPGHYTSELTIWFNNQVRSDSVALDITAIPHPTPWIGR